MDKYKIFFGLTFLQLMVLFALFLVGQAEAQREAAHEILSTRELVRTLELTDFSIWTEARYSRHPSQADLFSAFQNSPASLDHFPAGQLIPPPGHLRSQ